MVENKSGCFFIETHCIFILYTRMFSLNVPMEQLRRMFDDTCVALLTESTSLTDRDTDIGLQRTAVTAQYTTLACSVSRGKKSPPDGDTSTFCPWQCRPASRAER